MKFVKGLGVISTMLFFLISGCGTSSRGPSTDENSLKSPNKEILITGGSLNLPYDLLGEVKCTRGGYSWHGSKEGQTEEINNLLRKVAFTKFGNKVDAIINVAITFDVDGGFLGTVGGAYGAPTGVLTGKGIAVRFK